MAVIRMLKLIARYGAYALVIFEIIEFAISKLEPLMKSESQKTKKDGVVSE